MSGEDSANRFVRDVKDLVREVREMRKLQRKYFASRDHQVLEEAEACESRVDKILREFDGEPMLW